MALHRDIYWVGRQWSVTGYGLQLIDQRLKGVFDIEIARLWDQSVLDAMRAHDWLKAEDFDKAIAAAHKRFPEPAKPRPDQPSKPALAVETLLRLGERIAVGPAPAKSPPCAVGFRAESGSAKADLERKPASPVATPSRPSEPVLPVPAISWPSTAGFHAESEDAKADLQSKPAFAVETLSRPSEPVFAAPERISPSTLDFRTESERAMADLQSKMSALDGLLRSRGFVARQPAVPSPAILPVRAEGELAKFAPQWRVRN